MKHELRLFVIVDSIRAYAAAQWPGTNDGSWRKRPVSPLTQSRTFCVMGVPMLRRNGVNYLVVFPRDLLTNCI